MFYYEIDEYQRGEIMQALEWAEWALSVSMQTAKDEGAEPHVIDGLATEKADCGRLTLGDCSRIPLVLECPEEFELGVGGAVAGRGRGGRCVGGGASLRGGALGPQGERDAEPHGRVAEEVGHQLLVKVGLVRFDGSDSGAGDAEEGEAPPHGHGRDLNDGAVALLDLAEL